MDKITPNLSGPLVVALVYDGLCTFEFSIAAEIFGLARPEMGESWYRFASAAIDPGPMRAQGRLRVETDGGTDLIEQADLIIVPGWKSAATPVPDTLTDILRAAHARGARLASICSGAFVLAATGLLDGKRIATHWRYAETLALMHPACEVDSQVLYVEEARILTSAGSAAGIDLMLHIIRTDFGTEAANSVARRLVMPPHRNGGQAQFIERPVPATHQGRLSDLLERVRAEPSADWSVNRLAAEAAMSPRTLLRRFAETTGLAPGEWVTSVRVEEAKRLLETTRLPVEHVAEKAGFGTIATLRHHFHNQLGLAPREYRERFASRARHGLLLLA
ncbi:MAG: transcriptional regulator FtrA [Sphingomonadaceae bacterium]|nr:transcriptional regulator FtrA [Sphingomonadaceae bacterium]